MRWIATDGVWRRTLRNCQQRNRLGGYRNLEGQTGMEADDKEMQCRALWVHRVLCAKDLSAKMACREKVVEVE